MEDYAKGGNRGFMLGILCNETCVKNYVEGIVLREVYQDLR